MGGGEIKLFSLKADNTSGEPCFFTEQESGAATVELPQRRHPTQTIQTNKTEVLGDYYPSQQRPQKHTPRQTVKIILNIQILLRKQHFMCSTKHIIWLGRN